MIIKFTNIRGKHFCGLDDFDFDLYDRTQISGSNGLGKTTLVNAILFVLFNKNMDGSVSDNIRPHNDKGEDYDFVEIEVELTMMADDKEIVIKKVQTQNWITDRTTRERKFKGNVNEYSINGIPKKEKDFKEYIEQYVSLDTMYSCINPMGFIRLDTKKRREFLFSLVEGYTDDDVIKTNPNFECLKRDLEDGSVPELIARCKKSISVLKEKLKTIPARIDELTLQFEDVDVERVNEAKTNFLEAKSILLAKIDKANAEIKKKESIREQIYELKDKLSRLQLVSKEDSEKDSYILLKTYQGMMEKCSKFEILQSSLISNRDRKSEEIKRLVDSIEGFKKSLSELDQIAFDEKSLTCPVCGSRFSKEDEAKMRSDFDKHKEEEKKSIESKIKSAESEIESLQDEISKMNSEIDENEELQKARLLSLESMKQEYEEKKLTTPIQTDEMKEIQISIANLESQLFDDSEHFDTIEKCMKEVENIDKYIEETNKKLMASNTNESLKERIEVLKKELLETSQKIASEEKMLDLLDEFSRTKIGFLTEKINSYFRIIKWQMFREQINGGYAEVCIPLVDGTSYDGLLNHGNKILAEIDICEAFQKSAGITCPIFVDDSESLDAWRIPETESQIILLRRTDERELSVEIL